MARVLRSRLLAATIGLVTMGASAACQGGGSTPAADVITGAAGQFKVGVIMPDDDPAQRWAPYDTRFLRQAFATAGVPVDIENARRDPARFKALATGMIHEGVQVLIITNLDAASGKAVLDEARVHHVRTIDYDRLTLGGGADYYVSFDNDAVGTLQANGLRQCLAVRGMKTPVIAEMNGAPTDNNASQFKEGADQVLEPLYDKGTLEKGPDQWVPNWDYALAGQIFAQMLSQQPRIRGVLAANDGIAGAVISVLARHGLSGQVPVTGQDATVPGLQRILAGQQCMTVYKPMRPEAQTAAAIAVSLYTGKQLGSPHTIKDPVSGAWVPFFKLQPQLIDANTVKTVVADGYVTKKDLCTASYAKACQKYGVQ